MLDEFFNKKNCDRCGEILKVRIMSWFTKDTLCMACKDREDQLKQNLEEKGTDVRALEGCGYIPKE